MIHCFSQKKNQDSIEILLQHIEYTSKQFGLILNKSKRCQVNAPKVQERAPAFIDGTEVLTGEQSVYLGGEITHDSKAKHDVDARLSKAYIVWHALRSSWGNKFLSIKHRNNTIDSIQWNIFPVLRIEKRQNHLDTLIVGQYNKRVNMTIDNDTKNKN